MTPLDERKRVAWPAVVDRARAIVASYDTGVTLRQLFYRLVSEQLIPNNQSAYGHLSRLTAEARRRNKFPDLLDLGRNIHRRSSWSSVPDVLHSAWSGYRRDRTEGQAWSIYLAIEKRGIVQQLDSWFADLGLPILPLGGYSSQTFADDVRADAERIGRPTVLIYAGDFDASGEDIDRDFMARTDCWDKAHRIALTRDQVEEFELPVNPGKAADSRAQKFVSKHGELVQVEIDALPPDVLHGMFLEAIGEYWDERAYRDVLERESSERDRLRQLVEQEGGAA